MTDSIGATGPSFRARRILLILCGALAALVGLGVTAASGLLVWAHAAERDPAGYYTTAAERFSTGTYALTSRIDLGEAPGQHDWLPDHPVGTVRLRADRESREIFVGIAPQDDVDRWLAGVAHEQVTGANFGPFRSRSTVVAGDRPAGSPADQTFWATSIAGSGLQTLGWPSEAGRWVIVLMNADARPGVTAEVSAGARTAVLLPIGLGLGLFGLLLLAGASGLLLFGLRHQVACAAASGVVPAIVLGAYPARLDGHLDPRLSRWLWVVKWVLLIPHVVVLAFLWLAVTMLTVVAGFSILFTGRYPRAIFDFNLGVMRWTWRVSFYAISAFGTDRYRRHGPGHLPGFPASGPAGPQQRSRRFHLLNGAVP